VFGQETRQAKWWLSRLATLGELAMKGAGCCETGFLANEPGVVNPNTGWAGSGLLTGTGGTGRRRSGMEPRIAFWEFLRSGTEATARFEKYGRGGGVGFLRLSGCF